ncbi:tRNA selenocysteine [Nesidiocoris tenuis]|nr:tRNA selenocysteine [Nesidiocoris tenuis]
MNGYKNLGSKPIKISNAIPKTQRNSTSNGGQQQSQQSGGYQYPQDYSHYYDPNSYWQNYSQWGGYGYDPNTGYSYDPSSYAAAQQYGSAYQTQYGQYPPSSATGYSQQGGYGSYSGGPYSSYYPQPQGGTTAQPPSSMTSNSGTQPAHGSVSSAAVVDEANEIVEHSKKIDVEKENKEYAESILDHLADLASTTLVDRQLFQDEMYKLDIIDVSIPRLPAKLINQDEARRAVEAQEPFIQLDADLMGPLEASPDEGSEEPAEKKRKLSTHEESTKEAELEEAAKADETDKVPEETVVKVEQEDEETREKKAKQKEEWAQAKRFMAEVDVLPMMTETESVSSESTRISDDDIESLNGESKTESQAKETQIAGSANAMETDDGAADVRVEENAAENLRSENESTSERLGDSKYDPDDDSMEDADPETPAESTAAPTTSLQESTAAPSPQQSSRMDDTTEFHRVTRSGARKQAAPPIEEVQFVDETSQLSETVEELDAEPIVDEDSLDDQPLSARLGSCDLQRSPTEEVIIEDCTDSRISGSGSVEDVNLRTTVISSDDSSSRGSVDASNLIGNLVNGEDDAESLQEETRDADSQDGSDSSED